MSFINSHDYWLQAHLPLPDKCETRSIQIITSLIVTPHLQHSEQQQLTLRTVSVCPPWTWTPLPFCSLTCCSSETPVQKGQTDTSKSVVLSVFRCLGSWRTTMHFLVLRWKCLCLCVSALVQQVTIATPTGCCSGQLPTEAQKTNYWTSKLWTSGSYRSTTLYRPGFGILRKEKWSSEWLLAQPPLFIHVCPPLGTVNTACRTTNI